MITSERSSFIFNLAEEIGLKLEENQPEFISNEGLQYFCTEYKKQAILRDSALSSYLNSVTKPVRCYLPKSSRTFRVAKEVVWYFDELIVRDPIEDAIGTFDMERFTEDATHDVMQRFVNVIHTLLKFRHCIDEGYILLAGEGVLPKGQLYNPLGLDDINLVVERISKEGSVSEALNEAVTYGMIKQTATDGIEWLIYHAKLDSGELCGFEPIGNVRGTGDGIAYEIGGHRPTCTADDINFYIPSKDVREGARDLFQHEIARAISLSKLAKRLNAPMVFDRDADKIIVDSLGETSKPKLLGEAYVNSARLLVPYVQHLPVQRLIDLREDMPVAFKDFRSRLAEIMLDSYKEDPENATSIAHFRVEKEVRPSLNVLEQEIKAVSSKNRITGYSGALIASAGLLGAFYGMGWAAFSATAGGVAMLVNAASDTSKITHDSVAKPYYFLWKAMQLPE